MYVMAEAIDKHDKASSDEGSNPSASSTQPSLSMRVLQYGLKKKFPRVNHLSCEELERLRQQQLDHRSLVVLVSRRVASIGKFSYNSVVSYSVLLSIRTGTVSYTRSVLLSAPYHHRLYNYP